MVYPICYAVKHLDEQVVMLSRSGGIFTAISDYVFNHGGIVYGCVLDDKHMAHHSRATNANERDRMRGSKYVQSNMGRTFRNVKEDISKGKLVLFTGTPCQVAGLKLYLGERKTNLLTIDILCHGVPSPLLWKKYLEWNEQRKHKRIVSVDFRDKKKYGWRPQFESLTFEDGNVLYSETYKKLYYGHNALRKCCYVCPYKSTVREGDVSIADYWNIEKAAPEFDDNKGVSLVIINNDIGEKLFSAVSSSIRYKETKIEDSIQNALVKSYPEPKIRSQFWEDLKNKRFEYVAKKYGNYGFRNRILTKFRKMWS